MLLSIARKVLERAGYSVVTASNGLEAYELFADAPDSYSAVLLDCRMPMLGGLDAWRKMQSLRPGLPVLFCSGDSDASDIPSGDEARVLHKPFSLTQMVQSVGELTGKSV